MRLLLMRYRPKIVALMSLEPGHKLAHYEVLELIGRGGMDSPRRIKRKPSCLIVIRDSLFGWTTGRSRKGFLVEASQWRWGECGP